jgi:hypothetical protein
MQSTPDGYYLACKCMIPVMEAPNDLSFHKIEDARNLDGSALVYGEKGITT